MDVCPNLLFLALAANNISAINYFLDRKEMLLESSLPLFEFAGFKTKSGQELDHMRNLQNTIILGCIFPESFETKKDLLHHPWLNDVYSGALLNLPLNDIFALMFPGSETYPGVQSSRL
jgi:hypothetical protein